MRDLFIGITALVALAPSAAMAAEGACPSSVTPELEASLGTTAAALGGGQSLFMPQGLTMLGRPVSYVLMIRQDGGEAAAVTELDYRLQGTQRPYGERYAEDLRKAFDESFSTTCGTGRNASCVVAFRDGGPGTLSGAELGLGNMKIGDGASGDGLKLAEADFDLDGADPVFVVCLYKAP